MRAVSTMPLPKSVLCGSCRHTYPEGWRRCPYCGHDELRSKLEQQSKRFMEKKVREFEQKTGTPRKGERPRGGERGKRDAPRGERRSEQPRSRDRKRLPLKAQGLRPAAPAQRPSVPQGPEGSQLPGSASRKRRRRRGRGGSGPGPQAGVTEPRQPQQSAPAQPRGDRGPRPQNPERTPRPPGPEGGSPSDGPRKKRRFRRRRRGGGGGAPEGGAPKGE